MNTSHGQLAYVRQYGPVEIKDVYAGGLRLVRTLRMPEQQKVLPIETAKLYPADITTYLIEREDCTPREATKLVAFWKKNPAKIPTDLFHFYKEQLK